ncbi:hypothetical protein HPB51_009278 [Rhipicephalus microplus]|uniref:HRDC domain-containing protein n=1 Tax=Rhipicephalus microplus TaxID=6941 RepID=A0A9J6EZS5_RHIMP|nr:hypothetical protein HPB51_009278 [Rhipicephalus microplus]
MQRYEKPSCHEQSYMELYRKSRKTFNSRQLHALRHLYSWRDKVARVEDESTGYVLPNHMILEISEILPRGQCQNSHRGQRLCKLTWIACFIASTIGLSTTMPLWRCPLY